ncbi:MAG: hypothetical protein WC827_02035 [Candidatus Paceibacterota bacterium]|jgi:CheY-like chemotaxis protein
MKKILFIGDRREDRELWDLSGCNNKGHVFLHKTVSDNASPAVLEVIKKEPDIIVISFNIGSMNVKGPDFVRRLKQAGCHSLFIENTATADQSFSHHGVELDLNAHQDPDELMKLVNSAIDRGLV